MRKRPDSMERDHAVESIRKNFIENLKKEGDTNGYDNKL